VRAAPATAVLSLPWGAWHGDRVERFDLPPAWRMHELCMAGGMPLSDDDLARALDTPRGAATLTELGAGARSAVIAIDDITRPVKTADILCHIVERLNRAGMPDSAIDIVVASGAHRRATARDIDLKVGSGLSQRVRIVPHDPCEHLLPTGVALGGVPIRLNETFLRAELRIGISGVMPHPFAGYSGGGKIVIPGLADLDVLARTHKYALMGFGVAKAGGVNRFRAEMENAVRTIGLQWSVNVVVNENRDAVFMAAGDLVEAHRAAADAARTIGATPAPTEPLDALIINAYPKDSELVQIEAALTSIREGMLGWLRPEAPIVLTAACPDGLGVHGLFGPGARLSRTPSRKTFLERHPLIVFCPTVDEDAVRTQFWSGYQFCSSWDALRVHLQSLLPGDAHVGVLPCGPLQVAA
jgi:nickel-dependent lactate racemase